MKNLFWADEYVLEIINGDLIYSDLKTKIKYIITKDSIKGIDATRKMASPQAENVIKRIEEHQRIYNGTETGDFLQFCIDEYRGNNGGNNIMNGKKLDKLINTLENVANDIDTIRYNSSKIKEDVNENKSNSNNSMSKLEEALLQGIIEKGKNLATEELELELKSRLNNFIEETYGILPKVVQINNGTTVKQIDGIFHREFENILKIVDKKIPLMLTGPAGSGKNHTLEQVAKALDLDFYFTNAVTQEYKLTGFIDANGTYHETEFYKAFKNGGIFFLDEMDASCPEALIVLNSAIANGYFDFPNGRINANENFRVVSASNTYGTGADMIYVGRNVLDGATLDRFAVIKFDYDEEVEKQLAYDNELYTFIKALREVISENSLRYVVSMRATINASKMLEIGFDKSYVLKNAIIKNMQIDDINTIINKINCNNDWVDNLRRFAEGV